MATRLSPSTTRLSLLGLTVTLAWFFCAVVARARPCGNHHRPSPKQPPCLLLTGYEPFGEGRPPNPSWEGIKELDGQLWKGYRLVCKQLPVVWGAPLEQLEPWVFQYQPVAIFSFGQGGPRSFAIESYARNERGGHKDNKGGKPEI